MASHVYVRNPNGTTYVYENISYWDKEKKKTKHRRKCIGKIDPGTNQIIPTGRKADTRPDDALQKNVHCRVLTTGPTLLLDKAIAETGLGRVLRSIFPEDHRQILRKSTRGFNQIHVNAFFSILDSRFTNLVIQPGRKRNEYSAFCQMVDSASRDGQNIIYICDRGYASYNNFAHVIENGQYFLIRCNDTRTERILGISLDGVKEMDVHADRILTRSHSKKKMSRPELEDNYRFVCDSVDMDYLSQTNTEYDISLRIVRIELSDGCFENLVTNLPDIEFDIEDFKDLYHLRWNEGNAFRDIKYPLCLKAFHSKKYEYIVQEVWVRAILYNFCADITKHVEIPDTGRKHEYQINFSQACKTCREFLRLHDGSSIDVETVIADNIEPVRTNRVYPRLQRFKMPISFCYRN